MKLCFSILIGLEEYKKILNSFYYVFPGWFILNCFYTSPNSYSMFQRLRKGRERRVEKVSEWGMMYARMRQSLVHWKLYDIVERKKLEKTQINRKILQVHGLEELT